MKSFINKTAINWQLFIGIVTLNVSLFIIYAPNHFFFEMLQSMGVQIFFSILGLFLLSMLTRKWFVGGIAVISLFLLFYHLPITASPKYAPNTNNQFSITHFNVLKYNPNYAAIIKECKANNSDFLSFNEVTYEWALQLEHQLREEYPFYYSYPQAGSFGIAVFSKHPLTNVQLLHSGNIPFLQGGIDYFDTPIHFIAAHTIPPTHKNAFYKRNLQLSQINHLMAQQKGPKFLVGDLNAVSWSHPLKTIVTHNQLADSRQTFAPTYPSWNKWLSIPIDHIFYSKEFTCSSFQTIYVEGSDHLGINTQLHLPSNQASLQ